MRFGFSARPQLEGETLSGILGRSTKNQIELSISGPTSILCSRVTNALIPYYKRFPQVSLHLNILDTPDPIAELKKGKTTFCIVDRSLIVNELDSRLLKPFKFILVGAVRLKNQRTKEILANNKIIDFAENDSTTLDYLKYYHLDEYFSYNPRMYVNHNFCLIELIKNGIGIGTLAQEIAAPLIKKGEIIALNGCRSIEHSYALAWYPRKEMPLYFSELVKSIK